MNLSATNPALTPPRRGPGRAVLLPAWGAAADQEASFPFDNERGKTAPGRGGSFSQIGQLIHPLLSEGKAVFS